MGSRGPPVHRRAPNRRPALQALGPVTCGAAAAEAANQVRADLFLLGVTGVHCEAGLTTGDADEAAMKRTLARQTADTYVLALASSEKIGTASPFTVLPVASVSGLITDATDDRPVIAELLKQERRS